MKEITLTQGQITLVDDHDFIHLSKYKWMARKEGNSFYAARNARKDGMRITLRMHRAIMNVAEKEVFVDHRDGNGLNNQRSNLRICTRAQNQANRSAKKNGSSKYLGVHKASNRPGWVATVSQNNKKAESKYCLSEIEAAKEYNIMAIKYHKEFARLNII